VIGVFRRCEGRVVLILAAAALLGLALARGFSDAPEISLPAEFRGVRLPEPLNLNRASFAELSALPGIGPRLLERLRDRVTIR
jgi:DNA uptake protein ComE-like DNA-binding protein